MDESQTSCVEIFFYVGGGIFHFVEFSFYFQVIVCKKTVFPTRGNTEKEGDSASRITIKVKP